MTTETVVIYDCNGLIKNVYRMNFPEAKDDAMHVRARVFISLQDALTEAGRGEKVVLYPDKLLLKEPTQLLQEITLSIPVRPPSKETGPREIDVNEGDRG